MFDAQSSVFVYAASAHSGKSVDKFNFDIREGFYVLNRKIGKAFDKLPFPDMVREGVNPFYLEVREGVDHLDLDVGVTSIVVTKKSLAKIFMATSLHKWLITPRSSE